MEKTHFQLGEDESFFLQVSQNPLQIWEKISKKYYSIMEIKINVQLYQK